MKPIGDVKEAQSVIESYAGDLVGFELPLVNEAGSFGDEHGHHHGGA